MMSPNVYTQLLNTLLKHVLMSVFKKIEQAFSQTNSYMLNEPMEEGISLLQCTNNNDIYIIDKLI